MEAKKIYFESLFVYRCRKKNNVTEAPDAHTYSIFANKNCLCRTSGCISVEIVFIFRFRQNAYLSIYLRKLFVNNHSNLNKLHSLIRNRCQRQSQLFIHTTLDTLSAQIIRITILSTNNDEDHDSCKRTSGKTIPVWIRILRIRFTLRYCCEEKLNKLCVAMNAVCSCSILKWHWISVHNAHERFDFIKWATRQTHVTTCSIFTHSTQLNSVWL